MLDRKVLIMGNQEAKELICDLNNSQSSYFVDMRDDLPKAKKTQRRFFFHYNKPESARQSKNVITVHWQGECVPVNDIKCKVPVESHARKLQPRCVLRGWAENVTVITKDGNTLATIS